MKKVQKMFCIITVLLVMIIFLTINSLELFADTNDILEKASLVEFTDEFVNYLNLSDEEKAKVNMPKVFKTEDSEITYENELKNMRMVGNSAIVKYSLAEDIPENLKIRDQKITNSCWAFAAISSLETNLSLSDHTNNRAVKIYDFSERHMEYATCREFLNGEINIYGFNRKLDSGGSAFKKYDTSYFTNGMGAVNESDLPFSMDLSLKDISYIQKEVVTQVYDTVDFPSYTPSTLTQEAKDKIKNHIVTYGSVAVGILGASPNQEYVSDASGNKYYCYNNETGALYCDPALAMKINSNGTSIWTPDHAVSLIGWDDNYSVQNFNANSRPSKDGAWIMRNSWGNGTYTFDEMREYIFYNFTSSEEGKAYLKQLGINWTKPSDVTDEQVIRIAESAGYTHNSDNTFYTKIGDDGIMYISYEDYNVYSCMTGIIKAENSLNYDNLYQYDELGSTIDVSFSNSNKIWVGNIFSKKSSGKEYLTQVSLTVPLNSTCSVYVNPNGTARSISDLTKVQLQAGESEELVAGYHTLEFASPIEITSNDFFVAVEIVEDTDNYVLMSAEGLWGEESLPWSKVNLETGKCFVGFDANVNSGNWQDLHDIAQFDVKISNDTSIKILGADSTIKAFTTNTIKDDSLKEIKITTPPNKTAYFEGENFDKTGMVVTAYLNNGTSNEITEYTITDGNDLSAGKTSVTISYEGKTATQAITVSENNVESISITTPPTKTSYKAGEDFDKTGMVITATYSNGDTREITDYEITDGADLKNGQTSVTISYEGKEVTQAITVSENKVTKIEITTPPTKTSYVEGQDFDKTGMIVVVTYEDGTKKEITSYTVVDGVKLTEDKTSVTIRFEGQETTQSITVSAKTATSIIVKTNPTKMTYIQNEEDLDLTGGIITVRYNDGSSEDVQMISTNVTVEGFDNSELGKNTITVKYLNLSTTFEVDIVAKELKLPENSDFSNASAKNRLMKIYYTSADSSQDYALINVEISNIKKATVNDSLSYAYYLSSKQSIGNIPESDWIKLENVQIENGKLTFQINTKDLTNYDEVSKSDNLYLYIKETAVRENQTKILITGSMNISKPEQKEEYVDGIKKETKPANGGNPSAGDDSIADGKYPFTGKVIVFFAAIVIISLGAYGFVKYRTIDK